MPGVSNVDTRLMTTVIRELGVCRGVIVSRDPIDVDYVQKLMEIAPRYNALDFVKLVAPRGPIVHESPTRRALSTVIVIDCGVKLCIVGSLIKRGLRVVRVPPWEDPQKFVEDAMEVEVDAVSDGYSVLEILIEHIEKADARSGNSSMATPTRRLSSSHRREIERTCP